MGKIFKLFGKLLIILVIVCCIPVSIPKLFGVQIYNVISGSMEPAIPIGSICYVMQADTYHVGDVIAFSQGNSTITHRIVEIDDEQKLITTKGDANNMIDAAPVAFVNVYGKVVLSIPVLGAIAAALSAFVGKILALCILILGIVLIVIADKLSSDDKNSKSENISKEVASKAATDNKKAMLKNPKVVLLCGIAILFVCSIGIFLFFYEYNRNDQTYEKVAQSYVSIEPTADWSNQIDVDFEALQKENPDCVGWLYVENTDISYPIMHASDNEYYLHRDFYQQSAKAGSIFLEAMNRGDFSDLHTIIYGHNMRNLSMFGSLKYFKSDEQYYDSHQYFQVITPTKKMRYEIFSYFDTEPNSWVYTLWNDDGEEYDSYIGDLKRKSYNPIEVEASEKSMVTLSTCSVGDLRFVVNGFLIDCVE